MRNSSLRLSITPRSDSVLGIIQAVNDKHTLLPEFQRDFRWQPEQTYDLFDSLAKGIFIGTIIYGKPAFGISCREIDKRPRRGQGSRAKLEIIDIDDEEARRRGNSESFRLVLDGQQRITAIYRAITGIDPVYLVLHDEDCKLEDRASPLEEMMDHFSGSQGDSQICISLSDAYGFEMNSARESTMIQKLEESLFWKSRGSDSDESQRTYFVERYLKGCQQVRDLFKREKLVSYYLLDMNLQKFCLFFERSNSKGIQLNFTDILAAKLYYGFNLRASIERFESDHPDIKLNRELIVRAISYLSSDGKEIDKSYILKNLNADHFNQHWAEVCQLYAESLAFLYENRLMLSQKWLPSENIILPLMMFRRELKLMKQPLAQKQLEFLKFWFWASVFAERYASATNEVMIEDAKVLKQVAHDNFSIGPAYYRKLTPRVANSEDVLGYKKRASSIYKGILNVINYDSQTGLLDWTNTTKLTFNNDKLHDHHIFPKAFLQQTYQNQPELLELMDSVANRALIPKLTNLKIGRKSPSTYLCELTKLNSKIGKCLKSHKIDENLVLSDDLDSRFEEFVKTRAESVLEIIGHTVVRPQEEYLAIAESSNSNKSQGVSTAAT